MLTEQVGRLEPDLEAGRNVEQPEGGPVLMLIGQKLYCKRVLS